MAISHVSVFVSFLTQTTYSNFGLSQTYVTIIAYTLHPVYDHES
jgi:hypothetical protein